MRLLVKRDWRLATAGETILMATSETMLMATSDWRLPVSKTRRYRFVLLVSPRTPVLLVRYAESGNRLQHREHRQAHKLHHLRLSFILRVYFSARISLRFLCVSGCVSSTKKKKENLFCLFQIPLE